MIAGLWLIFALRALLDGLNLSRSGKKERFNVGRLDAHRRTLQSMLATVGFVFLAILFLILGVALPTEELVGRYFPENPTLADATGQTDELTAELNPALALTAVAVNGGPVAPSEDGALSSGLDPAETPVPPTETPTPTPEPSPTPSPTPQIVFVNSPVVGLYMRDEPSGEIIVLLEDQTPLIIQGDPVSQDDIEWVQISTFDGQGGWVSRSFLTTVTPPTPVPEIPAAEGEG